MQGDDFSELEQRHVSGFCRVNCKNHRGWTSVYAAPRTWANLSCQRIELIGKRHLVAILDHELAFANHVHEFDASQDISG
jgi:hypothetical protein